MNRWNLIKKFSYVLKLQIFENQKYFDASYNLFHNQYSCQFKIDPLELNLIHNQYLLSQQNEDQFFSMYN